MAGRVCLELNYSKCEIISHDPVTIGRLLCAKPGLQVVKPEFANLVGSLICGLEGVKDLFCQIHAFRAVWR